MQAYIREHEVERLLGLYNDLQGMTENIRLQIQNVIESSAATDDDILAAALPHNSFDGIPSYSKGTASDKTAKIALSYEKSLDLETREAIKELESELLLIQSVVAKLDIALSVLPVTHKEIVLLRYCKGLRWGEIDNIVNKDNYLMSISAMKERGKEGIGRIAKICRIRIVEYEQVMRLFD